MRALWLENRSLRCREDVPEPALAPGEALLRVRCAGICNTDLELLRGYYPFAGVPGHEFVGEVLEAPGSDVWRGRRVVGEINAVCGECAACRAGRGGHCERRSVLGIRGRDGAFAERLTLPLANLHALPESLPDASAVFVEPLAAALRVQEQVEIGSGDRIVVIGPGKLGTLVARGLAAAGRRVVVAGRRAESLARLLGEGFETCLAQQLPERGADVVVECSGSSDGFALARRALRPGGTLVLKSTYAGAAAVDLSSLVVDELTLVGSRCGPFEKALAALVEGRVRVSDLVEARYPLVEGAAAFAHAARPGALKVLIEP
jgi:threonine dehydrogenase-like Zn-dependent dehydrogenase